MKNLKQIALACLLVLFLIQCNSTSLKNIFQNELDNYVLYSNTGEWEKLMDMTYPKVFEFSSKESLIESMKQMESSGLIINTKKAEVKTVSEPIVVDGVEYAHLVYNGEVEIEIDEKMNDQASIIYSQLKDSYSEGDVEFDEKNNIFHVISEKKMFAIFNNRKKTWSFFEYNESQKEYLNQLFPEEVVANFIK